MSEDILCDPPWKVGKWLCCWVLGGRSQRCHSASYNASYTHPQLRITQSRMSIVQKLRNPDISLCAKNASHQKVLKGEIPVLEKETKIFRALAETVKVNLKTHWSKMVLWIGKNYSYSLWVLVVWFIFLQKEMEKSLRAKVMSKRGLRGTAMRVKEKWGPE